jgi:hypothetical protein
MDGKYMVWSGGATLRYCWRREFVISAKGPKRIDIDRMNCY